MREEFRLVSGVGRADVSDVELEPLELKQEIVVRKKVRFATSLRRVEHYMRSGSE